MYFLRYTILMFVFLAGLLAAPVVYHYAQGNLSAPVLPPSHKADAVMVFTGSSDRIVVGYESYLKGLGKRLMITGYDYPRFAREPQVRKVSRKVRKDKVFIDLKARNTIENAKNGADWAVKNKVRSILLVTTADHMPRAYFELRRLLPDDVAIYTESVEGTRGDYPGMDSEQARLLCRLIETTTGSSFCYKTRDIIRTIETANRVS